MSNEATEENPVIFCTQRDLAWDAWQTVLGPAAKADDFAAWWDAARKHHFSNLRDLMAAAWSAASCSLPQFSAWWQTIVDSQPRATTR